MNKKLLSFLFVLFIFSSCNEAEQKLSQELNDQVMQLHDQLMGKTEDVLKLNHFSNLRPLCSYTNRHIKSNKI